MKAVTLLGFDFGLKRIGVAVGQTLTQTARPLITLAARDGQPRFEDIDSLIKTWQPDALVVGIPLNMDGTEQPITIKAREFAQQLQERYNKEVFEADERLTSVAAREHIFAKSGYRGLKSQPIDGVAAQLILESWLKESYT